jgi:hypothetical protein
MPSPELNLESNLPNGHRAVMASRREPADSLDFFPTPPWATRALCELVLPRLYEGRLGSVWEPACGEGHMSEVLAEYAEVVRASDIKTYRWPRESGVSYNKFDFLGIYGPVFRYEWVITNPPFRDKTIPFILKAIERAGVGVAMFLRAQWLEGCERYQKVFRPHPPTLVAHFAERVNLCRGRWDPDGTTATAYVWVVWLKGARRRPPMWIAPGCRKKLTRPDDRERFS